MAFEKTPDCLPTCCCLATFPLSDVIQTVFALLPGDRTDTFIDIYKHISVWICKNIPAEIKHILRLSRLMEYRTPEQDFN